MDNNYKAFRFHRTWAPDGRLHIHAGTHWLADFVISLVGPPTPEPTFPDHPTTRAEFYALMSEFAARGYADNLLDNSPVL